MTFQWFAKDMSYFRAMDQREAFSVMIKFVDETNRTIVEQFAAWLMPWDFTSKYVQKRLSFEPKEAFRRTFFFCLGHRLDGKLVVTIHQNGQVSPVELAVIDYVRAHGAFHMANLGAALGRPPTPDDITEVAHFLSLMTDKKWQRILSDSVKRPLDLR
jgi:hypothetical protein